MDETAIVLYYLRSGVWLMGLYDVPWDKKQRIKWALPEMYEFGVAYESHFRHQDYLGSYYRYEPL